MIVNFTEAELEAQEKIEAEFTAILEALEKSIETLEPKPVPNTNNFFKGLDPEKNPKEWEDAIKKENEAYSDWEQRGSDEWRNAKEQYSGAISALNEARNRFFAAAEKRQFEELGGELQAIEEDFKTQTLALIKSIHESEQKQQDQLQTKRNWRQSIFSVSMGGSKWLLEPTEIKRRLIAALHLHFDAVQSNEEVTNSFYEFIDAAIANSPLIADVGTGEIFGKIYGKPRYRTQSRPEDNEPSNLPSSIVIPTLQGYQYATSLYNNGNAYLAMLTKTDGLRFSDGKLFFDKSRALTEAEIQNMRTKEGIENIDLALLRVFYSIILTKFEETGCKELRPVISLPMPKFAEYLGLQSNLNKKDITGIVLKAQSFHNMVGVIHETRNGKPVQSLYPVMNFEGYDAVRNRISFSSPYMNHVIETIYSAAIRKDRKTGKPKLKTNGEPLRLASHSYLVNSDIAKERNKAAVENVFIIVTLIEQAGDNVPRIKAKTIIERNPQLEQRLEETAQSIKGRLLQRVFKKTWELLKTKTNLVEVYNNIQLPDPNDPTNIPTVTSLDSLVFAFPHDGKKQAK